MGNDLISIIIPVYNVKEYLCQCIESVCKQTYSNLEIILVDDGSTDESGKICDEYAQKDQRIQVIHKENGGLSDARNVGISRSKGRYVSCIDSDDYIAKNYIERLYELICKYHAQIAVCRFCYVYGDEKEIEDGKVSETSYDKIEALKVLFEEKEFGHYAHQKLFLAEIIKAHPYPIGKIYEDIATTYKMFAEANTIAYTQEQLYFYRQRPGSIIAGRNKKSFEVLNHIDEIQDYIAVNFPSVLPYTERLKVFYYLHTAVRLPKDKNGDKARIKIKEYILRNKKRLLSDNHIATTLKMQIMLYSWNETLYRGVWSLKEIRKQKKIMRRCK